MNGTKVVLKPEWQTRVIEIKAQPPGNYSHSHLEGSRSLTVCSSSCLFGRSTRPVPIHDDQQASWFCLSRSSFSILARICNRRSAGPQKLVYTEGRRRLHV